MILRLFIPKIPPPCFFPSGLSGKFRRLLLAGLLAQGGQGGGKDSAEGKRRGRTKERGKDHLSAGSNCRDCAPPPHHWRNETAMRFLPPPSFFKVSLAATTDGKGAFSSLPLLDERTVSQLISLLSASQTSSSATAGSIACLFLYPRSLVYKELPPPPATPPTPPNVHSISFQGRCQTGRRALYFALFSFHSGR